MRDGGAVVFLGFEIVRPYPLDLAEEIVRIARSARFSGLQEHFAGAVVIFFHVEAAALLVITGEKRRCEKEHAGRQKGFSFHYSVNCIVRDGRRARCGPGLPQPCYRAGGTEPRGKRRPGPPGDHDCLTLRKPEMADFFSAPLRAAQKPGTVTRRQDYYSG